MSESSPWTDLSLPSHDQIRARRVDADIVWDFFWAVDADRRPLLLLQHKPEAALRGRDIPLLEGIEIEQVESVQDHKLLFRLIDASQVDLFHQLCVDIVHGAMPAASEEEAVRLAIARTWRWHHLLRRGSNGKLSENEQKGLLGELLVLENYLLVSLDPVTAISCWTGPQGSPKDFEIGDVCIEVKVRRGAATPLVRISSEDQLDDSAVAHLFLYVLNVSTSVQSGVNDCSVTDVAKRVGEKLGGVDVVAADAFEERLSAAGFRWEDDYSESRWVVGDHAFYEVAGSFPRITASAVGAGVTRVSYSLSLHACDEYLVDDKTVLTALRGAGYANGH